jgi:hypothetical protein
MSEWPGERSPCQECFVVTGGLRDTPRLCQSHPARTFFLVFFPRTCILLNFSRWDLLHRYSNVTPWIFGATWTPPFYPRVGSTSTCVTCSVMLPLLWCFVFFVVSANTRRTKSPSRVKWLFSEATKVDKLLWDQKWALYCNFKRHWSTDYRYECVSKKGQSWDRAIFWMDRGLYHLEKTYWNQPHTCYR